MPRFFSERMLNPYHGIVNVVEIEGADAVCRDGITWTLYIQGEREREQFDDGSVHEVQLPDIKFGTWSKPGGLRRAPVRYVTDYDHLDMIGSRLLSAVKSRADRLPFDQQDRYELWLLDRNEARPLALLQSACSESATHRIETVRWNPGETARGSFRCKPAKNRAEPSINDADLLVGIFFVRPLKFFGKFRKLVYPG